MIQEEEFLKCMHRQVIFHFGDYYISPLISGKVIYSFEQRDNEIYTIDYAFDGSKFAVGGINKKVILLLAIVWLLIYIHCLNY